MSHPRTHPHAGVPGDDIRSFFQRDLHRPLVIVGNGPSAAFPQYDRLPDDPVVFRMNWFFLEDRYQFGRVVDGFFYSIPNLGLESRLTEVVRNGSYEVHALFSPMRVPSGRDGESHASELYEVGLTELDHWSLIAENAVLARFMMSRPLPTQGVQVLACALQLGFRDITVCGIDMYESTDARYGFAIPDDVRASLQAKDVTPGYEDAHSLDRDLDFLDACLALYGDADIKHIGPSRHLAERLRLPERRPRPCTFGGTPAPDLQRGAKTTFRVAPGEPGGLRLVERGALPFTRIDARRCGYVTFVSGPFHHGARALANSLGKVSDVPLLVMCAPSAERDRLEASGLTCVDVPEIYNPNTLSSNRERFAATYGKLNAFAMTHLDRAVYLDSDMIVLESIDDLFERDGFWAVPDHGIDHVYDTFNSGMFAYDPDMDVFDDMLGRISTIPSYDQGDQGFLNGYFGAWQPLPHQYNVSKRWSAHHPNLFRLEETRVLHYVGVKPWQPEANSAYDELYHLWFQQLHDDELVEVAESLRASSAGSGAVEPRYSIGHIIRALVARITGRRHAPRHPGPGPSRSIDDLHAAKEYEAALALLNETWPGDHAATAGLYRRRGTTEILTGDVESGVHTLRSAALRFPDDPTLARSLGKAELLLRVKRLPFVPDSVIVQAARAARRD